MVASISVATRVWKKTLNFVWPLVKAEPSMDIFRVLMLFPVGKKKQFFHLENHPMFFPLLELKKGVP